MAQVYRWKLSLWFIWYMMTSQHGDTFRITGPLCGETPARTSHRWIPLTKSPWCGTLMFSLLLSWINNSRVAGHLRRPVLMWHDSNDFELLAHKDKWSQTLRYKTLMGSLLSKKQQCGCTRGDIWPRKLDPIHIPNALRVIGFLWGRIASLQETQSTS